MVSGGKIVPIGWMCDPSVAYSVKGHLVGGPCPGCMNEAVGRELV